MASLTDMPRTTAVKTTLLLTNPVLHCRNARDYPPQRGSSFDARAAGETEMRFRRNAVLFQWRQLRTQASGGSVREISPRLGSSTLALFRHNWHACGV